MAKKIVTLYVDDTGIRLLVTSGQKVKKWADMPLQPGLVKNAVILKEASVASKIKQVLKMQKVRDKKVVVGISGLHCLSRPFVLPQLPKDMLEEAVKREAKRLLPVPLEQLYLTWETIPAPEGKTQIFLIAIPTKSADALFRMLRTAGLKTQLMDMKPLLLARAVKESTSIIVDVQPTEFDIAVMVNGLPQPVRTVALPGESLVWQEKLPLIQEELDRTIKFFNSNNPDKPLLANVPIFASGALADEPDLCQTLSDNIGHPVFILSSPLELPEGLDPNRYMVNIGLVLKQLAMESAAAPLVTNLNILPIPYRPEPISWGRLVIPPVAAGAIGLLVFVVTLIQGASADVAEINSQLNSTTQLIQQKLQQSQEIKTQITELQKKITDADTSGENLGAAVSSIDSRNDTINKNLALALTELPSGVSIVSLGQSEDKMTINCWAPTEIEIWDYMRSLSASNRFSRVNLSSLSRPEAGGWEFTLSLALGGKE